MAGLRAIAACVGVLAGANVMNNVVAKRWAPVTSALATGVILGIARREGLRGEALGFGRWKEGAAIGGGLAAGVAGAYAVGIGLPRTRSLFRDERALSLSRARLLEEALLQVPVGTVMLEEVAFRGVLPALLSRSLRPTTAAAVSSALFGLWHVLPALDMARANPSLSRLTTGEIDAVTEPDSRPKADAARLVAGTVATTSLAGFAFWELRRRGGLLAPALVHIATNSFGYAAARIGRRIDARKKRA
ncbi:abortive infection protein [Acrocarpospora phusangensis]|uniref:Abortive infection protein n=1 Tax=Acrocarpospora phusangensis TaxID=1070424 RepID=A0A919UTV8_9ACTN|nr:CPBP family intramembrane glutamic endopeptidase [Acrocarpospora phusangensis]GIH27800.1 abortive infection protein [Acrocarpospora phusangensis]